MSRIVPIRSLRIATFAAAVIVGGWTAERAEATCGDYVRIRGQKLHVQNSPMVEDAVHGEMDRGIHPASRDTESPQRTPCRGPTCSNGSFPPAAPVPSEPVSTEHWACSLSYGLTVGDLTSSLLPTSDVEPSAGVGLSIIRPPR